MKDPIRVGLIRCDTHGMWFGAQMDDHDPLLLRQPMAVKKDFRYSWQNGGCHYFFYTIYSRPWQMTAPRVSGFQIAKVWDEDRRSAEAFARVFHGRPKVCDSFDECSDGVDLVFIPEHGIVINCGCATFRFTEMFVTAYGPEGAILGQAMDDFNCSEGSAVILEHVKRMVKMGQPHPLSAEMVEAVAVAEAGRAAERAGRGAMVKATAATGTA